MIFKKILIGIDDSKYAEHAAAVGFDIAQKFNAHVGLVHIVEPGVMPPMTAENDMITGMPMQSGSVQDMELLDIREDQSANLIDRVAKQYGGELQVSHFNEFGSTADGIIDCSKEFGADLIVIGTHNRSGIDRLLMGSVAEHVVRHSTIPVLVVPTELESY